MIARLSRQAYAVIQTLSLDILFLQLTHKRPMMLKIFLVLASLLLPTLAQAARPATPSAQPSGTDLAMRQALLGTWQAVDSPTATIVNGEGTFQANGTANGYTTATYVYNDGYTSDVKVGLTFKWSLENSVLTLNNFVSDPSQFIKPTHVKRFEILSINPDGMTLKDLSDGEIVYRRRKPG